MIANPGIIVRKAGGPDRLELVDAPIPAPGPGQLLVRVEATGVAFADVVIRMGLYPGVKLPVTPGYEVVGTVIAGEGFAPGTRIAALTVTGGYAAHALVPAAHAVAVPPGLSASKAAALVLNGLTAWQMLTRCVARPSVEKMLVWGAGGGVGSILVELGRHFGIETHGVASGARLASVAGRGANPIDRAAGDVAGQVRAASGGGVDAVFDGVGGPNLRISRAALRPGGAVVMFGFQGALGGARFNPASWPWPSRPHPAPASRRCSPRARGCAAISSPNGATPIRASTATTSPSCFASPPPASSIRPSTPNGRWPAPPMPIG